ncbi:flagellar biosynthesis regulator FlaF [Amorphus orientalis]|uniref:Flagellar protein FlaF n=1 Tax=Amorphus orientalis TaxID=649198 RepID=A0AAE4ATS2_9HYPH|nr:flagellar biosynthesis regulator FlaF [Amorphus orientalis]MDQ0317576.1 flagellar protein FlaF [Amorphus orientalis]
MYKFSYAEVLDDSSDERRGREIMALEHGIALLRKADAKNPMAPESIKALRYVQQLWGFFIRDLADRENGLDETLRADLVSIGLWIIREADQIISGKSQNYAGLIDINRTIRDGLK